MKASARDRKPGYSISKTAPMQLQNPTSPRSSQLVHDDTAPIRRAFSRMPRFSRSIATGNPAEPPHLLQKPHAAGPIPFSLCSTNPHSIRGPETTGASSILSGKENPRQRAARTKGDAMADKNVENDVVEVPQLDETLEVLLLQTLEEAQQRMEDGEDLPPFTATLIDESVFEESHTGSTDECFESARETVEGAQGARAYAFCYDGFVETDDGNKDADHRRRRRRGRRGGRRARPSLRRRRGGNRIRGRGLLYRGNPQFPRRQRARFRHRRRRGIILRQLLSNQGPPKADLFFSRKTALTAKKRGGFGRRLLRNGGFGPFTARATFSAPCAC